MWTPQSSLNPNNGRGDAFPASGIRGPILFTQGSIVHNLLATT